MNTRIYVRASTKEQDAERALDDLFSSMEQQRHFKT
jgi:DNA invertase Pin-like site-specific DNA recombinase